MDRASRLWQILWSSVNVSFVQKLHFIWYVLTFESKSVIFCVPSVPSHSLTVKTRNEPPSVLVLLWERKKETIHKLFKTHTLATLWTDLCEKNLRRVKLHSVHTKVNYFKVFSHLIAIKWKLSWFKCILNAISWTLNFGVFFWST